MNYGTEDEPNLVITTPNWAADDAEKVQAYTIYFENKSTATAAAQEVKIDMQLPEAFDWATFESAQFSVGSQVFTLSDKNRIAENTWLADQNSTGEQIYVQILFDETTGAASWYLRSYVASTTDHFPASAYDGFLPPTNQETHDGEGYVSFTVRLDDGLPTNTKVETSATIIFDTNDPIVTNTWFNTIDADAPASTLNSAELDAENGKILLNWTGSDVGSGVGSYEIYVAANGGEFTLWNTFTTTSAEFEYAEDGVYAFYVTATDNAGLKETKTTQEKQVTTIENQFPVAADDSAEVGRNGEVEIDVLANDTDEDGDLITLLAVEQAQHGTVAIRDGKTVYTPNAGFHGTDSFAYTISDGKGATDSGTVSVTVENVVVDVQKTKMNVSWAAVDGAAKYTLEYKLDTASKWTKKVVKTNTASISGTAGRTYEIRVTAQTAGAETFEQSAVILSKPTLKADKSSIKDDTFRIAVTNWASKSNLAAEAKTVKVQVGKEVTSFALTETGTISGMEVTFDNGVFTFVNAVKSTSYKVSVQFSDGRSDSQLSSACSVKTLGAPYLVPTNVRAEAVGDTKIDVTWDAAKGKNSETLASTYTVQYSTDGGKRWTTATTFAKTTSYTITRLKASTEYQIRVLATKDWNFLASDPSETVTATTYPSAPKFAIARLSVNRADTKDDKFQINVTNYASSNLKTLCDAIDVTCGTETIKIILEETTKTGTGEFTSGLKVAFADGLLTFTDAESNTMYRIAVTFRSGNYSAQEVSTSVKTLSAAYLAPTNVSATAQSDTTIDVTWLESKGKNSETLASAYTIQYSTDGGKRWTTVTTFAKTTSYTITRLKASTEYQIRVFASKDWKFLASDPSATATATTWFPVPKITSVVSKVHSEAELKWNVTSQAEKYELQYRVAKTETWQTVEIVQPVAGARTVTCTLENLTSGLKYEFRLKVCTTPDFHESQWSAIKLLSRVK